MPQVRLTISQKRRLGRATNVLAKRRGHPVTEGQTVAEGARLVIMFNAPLVKDERRPLKPGEVDPLFDPRIVFEGLSPTASQDVDEILYRLKREPPRQRKARSRPAKGRHRVNRERKAADEN